MSKNKWRSGMRICVTAKGPLMESPFEPHFARAPCFVLFSTATCESEPIRNGFVVSEKRIGQNAVRLLVMNKADAVITGQVGSNARDLLRIAGIGVYTHHGNGTVREVLDTVHIGQEKELNDAGDETRSDEVPSGPGAAGDS
jgi:predicted Fe-Mo cluster-binding NifX family protein